ncbi:glycerol-3-phosphate acyltransferase PlsX [Desulfohalotomaculum tongense]|uniref:phosphate acyltransferase PlsX n=1 Tax=Desulforadius tongensis TaxID=1216062 RepID=UPI00195B520F|nr:phosphate acyltransferase PlsX [Desulforadius tongensis]MBM7854400.1 glycerol-3-phosphate acyltransferase PlsX [Desulforadius tongensis]
MRIALDAMGGDYAPGEIVRGALKAAEEFQVEIVLVGSREIIEKELKGNYAGGLVTVHHASEVIEMDEHPATAVRKKRDSSIVVSAGLVKQGAADAVISAGNTGAAMAASLFALGRIEGIERPAICAVLPTVKGSMILLDAGANVDCKPKHLHQFAVMGSVYAEKVLGRTNPRVALVNIGAEESKGNELTQTVYQMLKDTSGINFAGNIEGRELLLGDVDVAVCDGFVGNVLLKTVEGCALTLMGMIKKGLEPLAAEVGPEQIGSALGGIKQKLDYSHYGGAPLLGLNGVSIISHGSSNAQAIKNAVRVAKESVNNALVTAIADNIGLMTKGE